ncbi:hypothetical protein DERP_003194 [Dermatophagoides pteronyssinus]|uniref:Uncharacterized protein n=1 Tax=Dermatophagoides pteronyssinus TaxID=6956 RepID=A0ABQ8JIT5_DERPT|nr:hypothetical protein DERP_003194 [Dermatophagoides pteronyssinus]
MFLLFFSSLKRLSIKRNRISFNDVFIDCSNVVEPSFVERCDDNCIVSFRLDISNSVGLDFVIHVPFIISTISNTVILPTGICSGFSTVFLNILFKVLPTKR